jgi:hypothetical protein
MAYGSHPVYEFHRGRWDPCVSVIYYCGHQTGPR